MDDLQKMLAEMFPQGEDAITNRTIGMLFPDGDRSKNPQYNLTELIREANMSPKEYDRFIDLVMKNKLVNRKSTTDPDEVLNREGFTIRNMFSRALNPDNSIGESKLPYNPRSRGAENDAGVMQSLSMILGSREASPSLGESPKSKSIDDILRQSDISEFLSKAVSDKTNVDVKEDSQESDRSTYGGGTLGVVDSPMTMQMLMRNQEPVPQDTTGLPRMDIETLFRLLSPQMQEPTPSR
jgi:hypothetical protein